MLEETSARHPNNDAPGQPDQTQLPPQAKSKHELVIPALNAGLWELEIETQTFHSHDQFLALLGYDEDEIQPTVQAWRELIHPDDLARNEAAFQDALAGKTPDYRVELRLLPKSGKERWFLARGTVIRDDSGQPIRMFGATVDITETRRATDNALYHAQLLENVSDGVIATDLDHRIVRWNKAAERIYGWTAAEASGQLVDDLTKTEYPHDDGEDVLRQFQTHGIWTGEIEQRHKDGTCIDIFASVSLFRNDLGEPIGIVAVNRDITERKKAERELCESEAKYRSVFENASEGIAITQDGKVCLANRRAAELVSSPSEEILSKSPLDFVHSDDHERALSIQAAHMRGEDSPAHYQLRVVDTHGEMRWIDLTSVQISWAGKPATLNFVSDITDRKLAEEQLGENKRRFQIAAECASDLVYEWDIKTNRLEWFGDIDGALGHETGQFPRTLEAWLDRIHPEDRKAIDEAVHQEQEGGKSVDVRYRIRHADGAWLHWTDRGRTLFDDHGKPSKLIGVCSDVTLSKIAEDALRESEERYRVVSELTTDYAYSFRVEEEGQIECEWVTGALRHITGYTREELAQLGGWEHLVHPDDMAAPMAQLKALLRGESMEVEYRIRTKTGDVRWMSDFASPTWNDKSGRVVRILGSVKDITERRKADEELRKHKTIADKANFGMVICDLDGKLIYVNNYFAAAHGYRSDELLGWDLGALHNDDQIEGSRDFIRRLKERGSLSAIEIWHQARDGRTFPMLVNGDVISDKSGNPLFIAATATDISELNKAEKELTRLGQAIEQTSEIVIITDPQGVIQYTNPAFEQVSGFTLGDALGERLAVVVASERGRASGHALLAALDQQEGWQGRMACYKKDGSTYDADVTLSPVRDQSEQIVNFAVLIRDISEVARLESQLRQAQKMEAIGTLAGGIAHDFNNMLYAILGYTELAMANTENSSETYGFLAQVSEAGKRASDLVNQILTFSSRKRQEREPLSLPPVLAEALQLLRGSFPSTIEIRQDVDADCGLVKADPTEIHQVIMNLCTNAFHALRETGGTLDVRLKEEAVARQRSTALQDLKPGRYARLTVIDNGHGMDEQTLARIYEPYFTTKAIGQGTGMGLATVHGIVTSLEGAIFVESGLGKGSRFDVFLPLHVSETKPKLDSQAERAPSKGQEHVLFVDDEKAIIDLARISLENLGYFVTACQDSREALRIFRQDPDRFGLVITDQTMPGLTGAQLAEEMLELRPDIPIILCTGYSDTLSPERARSIGIRKYMNKPTTCTELAQAARCILDSEATQARSPEGV
ncbi:PAS domain S-box protein [Candidatus Eisenbacteria bacterium]|uniref:histidine kinase n=1 Tax=Eiseniibacteriota bacterium TaxID=2212470 RepID=A0ABV6YJG5_UNCEI